jgi:hypothetical protein
VTFFSEPNCPRLSLDATAEARAAVKRMAEYILKETKANHHLSDDMSL